MFTHIYSCIEIYIDIDNYLYIDKKCTYLSVCKKRRSLCQQVMNNRGIIHFGFELGVMCTFHSRILIYSIISLDYKTPRLLSLSLSLLCLFVG